MNLQLTGTITLRSSLAHGAFEAGAIVTPFRREPILQRDADGLPRMAAYASLVSDPVQRETLRQYAQRLLRIAWQSRSDATQWTYSQLAERVAVAARMKPTLADLAQELLSKLGNAGAPVYYNDDAEFLSGVLAAADDDHAGAYSALGCNLLLGLFMLGLLLFIVFGVAGMPLPR